MIVRIWHGYTTKTNAGAYEELLTSKILKEIEHKTGDGFGGVELLRRHSGEDEVEFTTMMKFDNLETIKKLAGDDYEIAYIPDEARKLLSRFDQTVVHSEVVLSRLKGL
jgi:antibiotic biosynthesis monooxygenase (ABM) superfamily enzyme